MTLEIVSDPLFEDNVGTWTIADGRARRSSRRPDVRLDVQALGSVFLGGFSFAELGARSGSRRLRAAASPARMPSSARTPSRGVPRSSEPYCCGDTRQTVPSSEFEIHASPAARRSRAAPSRR